MWTAKTPKYFQGQSQNILYRNRSSPVMTGNINYSASVRKLKCDEKLLVLKELSRCTEPAMEADNVKTKANFMVALTRLLAMDTSLYMLRAREDIRRRRQSNCGRLVNCNSNENYLNMIGETGQKPLKRKFN